MRAGARCLGRPRLAELAVARPGDRHRQLGQDRFLDGVTEPPDLAQRTVHEAGVVTRGAVVLLLPGERVLNEEHEPAFDRRFDLGGQNRVGGAGRSRDEEDCEEQDRSHGWLRLAGGFAPLAAGFLRGVGLG